jgi:hypothetical protein
MHSPWVSRLLSEGGHETIVAHARNVRLIGESRKKDDRLDARTLARLARIDPQLLSPVKHRSAPAHADLTVIRARAGLVRARTAPDQHGAGSDEVLRRALARLQSAEGECGEKLSPELQAALQPLLTAVESLSEQIREYNDRIEQLAKQSYPQVGMHISKEGDPYLRTLLVQGAHPILGPFGADSDLRRWGLKLAEGGGKNGEKRAVIKGKKQKPKTLCLCYPAGSWPDGQDVARRSQPWPAVWPILHGRSRQEIVFRMLREDQRVTRRLLEIEILFSLTGWYIATAKVTPSVSPQRVPRLSPPLARLQACLRPRRAP